MLWVQRTQICHRAKKIAFSRFLPEFSIQKVKGSTHRHLFIYLKKEKPFILDRPITIVSLSLPNSLLLMMQKHALKKSQTLDFRWIHPKSNIINASLSPAFIITLFVYTHTHKTESRQLRTTGHWVGFLDLLHFDDKPDHFWAVFQDSTKSQFLGHL